MSKENYVTDEKTFKLSLGLATTIHYKNPNKTLLNIQLKHVPVVIQDLHIIIITDVSSSMFYVDRNDVPIPSKDGILLSKEAIKQVINISVSENNEFKTYLSGIAFSHKATRFLDNQLLPVEETKKNELIRNTLADKCFDQGGGTDFYQAFLAIKEEWLQNDRTIRVYFLTDGCSDKVVDCEKIFKELAEKAKIPVDQLSRKCPIYVLGIGEDYDGKIAEKLSRRTGGEKFHLKQTSDIPKVMNILATNINPFNTPVYAQRCIIKGNNISTQFCDFGTLPTGVNTQEHSFSLPTEVLSEKHSLSIHLQLNNKKLIIFEDITELNTTHNSQCSPQDFINFLPSRVNEIATSIVLARHEKISEFTLLKEKIQELLNQDLSAFKTLDKDLATINKCLKDFASAKGEIGINTRNDLITSNNFRLKPELLQLLIENQDEKESQEEKLEVKSKQMGKFASQNDWKIGHNCFEITQINFKKLIGNGREAELSKFAYLEEYTTGADPKITTDRFMTTIEVKALSTQITQTKELDIQNLVVWVKKYFNPMDEKNTNTLTKIIQGRKLATENNEQHILDFSEFIGRRAGNSIHRAVLLAILANSNSKLKDISHITLYKSHNFNGDLNAFVLLENKDFIQLADPVYGITFNLKNISGRESAEKFYQEKGLEGILFQLCVEKGWRYRIEKVSLIPIPNETEEQTIINLGLTCPLTLSPMGQPVHFFSDSKHKQDEKEGKLPRWLWGIITPEVAFEKWAIEEFLTTQAIKHITVKNPYTNLPLPQDYKLIPATFKAMDTWYYCLSIANRRMGAFEFLCDDSKLKNVRKENPAYIQNLKESSTQEFETYYFRDGQLIQATSALESLPDMKAAERLRDEFRTQIADRKYNTSPPRLLTAGRNLSSCYTNTAPRTLFTGQSTLKKTGLSFFERASILLGSNTDTIQRSKIIIYLTNNQQEMVIKFVNKNERDEFLFFCGQSKMPERWRPKNNQKLLQNYPDWKIPAVRDNENEALYFLCLPYPGVPIALIFENIKTLEKIMQFLRLPLESKSYGNEVYAEHLLQKTSFLGSGVICCRQPTSYLLKPKAFIIYDRKTGVMTYGLGTPSFSESDSPAFSSSSLSSSSSSSSASSSYSVRLPFFSKKKAIVIQDIETSSSSPSKALSK